MVIFVNVNATIYQTVANGDWKSSSTWSPSKPTFPWGSTDTVIINHTINLNATITTYGVVIINSGASLTSTTKSITVGQGSKFTNNGTVSVKNFYADWGTTTIENTGSLSTTNNMTVKEGTFTNSGTISVGKSFINDYNSNFTNTSTGVMTITKNFTNRDVFTNAGTVTVSGNFVNDWGYTVSNTGTINVTKDITNRGTLTTSGTMSAGDDFVNDWGCTFSNTGNFSSTDDFTNRGTSTNSGTIVVGDDMSNKGTFTNSNTITVGDDFTNDWSTTLNNTGDITVTDDVSNNGTIHNNGNFEVDGNYTGSGDVDGTGSLCNSDGVTDPTGGAKSVSCPICGDGGTLPVELIDFSVIYNTNIVTLSWSTASESNNDRFEVEKSTNGVDFEVIGIVSGMGNSNTIQDYSFEEVNPQSGVIYYRLVQIDYDGTESSSKIIKVNIQKSIEVKLYPNPVNSGENLNMVFNTEGEKIIEVYEISGKLIRSYNTRDNKYRVNTNELKTGIYIVRIISNDKVISKRIQIR